MSKLLFARAVVRFIIAILGALLAAVGLVVGKSLIGDQWAGNAALVIIPMSLVAVALIAVLVATNLPVLRGRDPVALALQHPALETTTCFCAVLLAVPGVLAIEMANGSPGRSYLIGLTLVALLYLGVELAGALFLAKRLRILFVPAALAAIVGLAGVSRVVVATLGGLPRSWQEAWKHHEARAWAASIHGDADLVAIARKAQALDAVTYPPDLSGFPSDIEEMIGQLAPGTVRSPDTVREFGRVWDDLWRQALGS